MPRQVLSPDREVLVLGKLSEVTISIRPDLIALAVCESCAAAELDPGGMTKQKRSEVSPTRLVFFVAATSRSTKLISRSDISIVCPHICFQALFAFRFPTCALVTPYSAAITDSFLGSSLIALTCSAVSFAAPWRSPLA